MKYTFNKILKGLFAIFTIKLVLFGGFMLFQACQTDQSDILDIEQVNEAEENFLAALQQTRENLRSIPINQNINLNDDTDGLGDFITSSTGESVPGDLIQEQTRTVCLIASEVFNSPDIVP